LGGGFPESPFCELALTWPPALSRNGTVEVAASPRRSDAQPGFRALIMMHVGLAPKNTSVQHDQQAMHERSSSRESSSTLSLAPSPSLSDFVIPLPEHQPL
jgi:hypothetical protein